MKTAIKVTLGTMLTASFAPAAQANVWDGLALTGTATYTKASNNGLSMGDLQTAGGPGVEGGRRAFFVEPDHEWDWGIGFSFRLDNGSSNMNDTRLYLDYDHFRDNEARSAPGLRNIGFAPPPVTNTAAKAHHRAQQFRVGIAQTLHFGPRLDLDLKGFFDYTKLEKRMTELTRQDAVSNFRNTEDDLKGFGIGFGAVARGTPVSFYPEFGIFGGMHATLLSADQKYHQTYLESLDAESEDIDFSYDYNPEDSKSVVTKFDAEVGIDYKRMINSDMGQCMFHIELGVRFMNVVNAFKSGNTAWNPSVIDNDENITFAQWTGHPYDFGRMGPFLRVTIGGAYS